MNRVLLSFAVLSDVFAICTSFLFTSMDGKYKLCLCLNLDWIFKTIHDYTNGASISLKFIAFRSKLLSKEY